MLGRTRPGIRCFGRSKNRAFRCFAAFYKSPYSRSTDKVDRARSPWCGDVAATVRSRLYSPDLNSACALVSDLLKSDKLQGVTLVTPRTDGRTPATRDQGQGTQVCPDKMVQGSSSSSSAALSSQFLDILVLVFIGRSKPAAVKPKCHRILVKINTELRMGWTVLPQKRLV
ncbi:hypothetical protein J6590_016939 [Homalodisca vitripennis]|nr:hypothetical protein J6590_016939 [Homalodisca vitripennis]